MAVAFFHPFMLTAYIPDNCIAVPETDLPINEDFNAEQYPHFSVFCTLHLGTGMDYSQMEENARIIGAIPDDQIRLITAQQLMDLGCDLTTPNYWD